MNMNVVLLSAWMLWSTYALGTRPEYALCMGAPVMVCSWNENVIMVWEQMLWSPNPPGTQGALVHVCA